MKAESRPEAANDELAGGPVHLQDTVDHLLNGEIQPHELEWDLWRVWADGFHAGVAKKLPELDRANGDADWWYYVANNPEEVRAEHARMLKHASVVAHRRTRAEGVSA